MDAPEDVGRGLHVRVFLVRPLCRHEHGGEAGGFGVVVIEMAQGTEAGSPSGIALYGALQVFAGTAEQRRALSPLQVGVGEPPPVTGGPARLEGSGVGRIAGHRSFPVLDRGEGLGEPGGQLRR